MKTNSLMLIAGFILLLVTGGFYWTSEGGSYAGEYDAVMLKRLQRLKKVWPKKIAPKLFKAPGETGYLEEVATEMNKWQRKTLISMMTSENSPLPVGLEREGEKAQAVLQLRFDEWGEASKLIVLGFPPYEERPSAQVDISLLKE